MCAALTMADAPALLARRIASRISGKKPEDLPEDPPATFRLGRAIERLLMGEDAWQALEAHLFVRYGVPIEVFAEDRESLLAVLWHCQEARWSGATDCHEAAAHAEMEKAAEHLVERWAFAWHRGYRPRRMLEEEDLQKRL